MGACIFIMEDKEDSATHPLVLARNSLEDQFVSLDIDGSSLMGLFEVDPEACVRSLDSPYQATALKKRLRTAERDWIKGFLDAGGLEVLWNMLDSCVPSEDFVTIAGEALQQGLLRCVECMKTLLSFPVALDTLVIGAAANKYIDRLLKGEKVLVYWCASFTYRIHVFTGQ